MFKLSPVENTPTKKKEKDSNLEIKDENIVVTAKLDEEGQPLFTIADMHYNDSYDLQFSLHSY